jgi:hypothetical protein
MAGSKVIQSFCRGFHVLTLNVETSQTSVRITLRRRLQESAEAAGWLKDGVRPHTLGFQQSANLPR